MLFDDRSFFNFAVAFEKFGIHPRLSVVYYTVDDTRSPVQSTRVIPLLK
jgi:hypothetical protein